MNEKVVKLARFRVGEIIHHRLFDYRGAIFDVDPEFRGDDAWYAQMAKSKPPKDRPWYHVLVDGATHTTYVAEQNLDREENPQPITHPALSNVFSDFLNGKYKTTNKPN